MSNFTVTSSLADPVGALAPSPLKGQLEAYKACLSGTEHSGDISVQAELRSVTKMLDVFPYFDFLSTCNSPVTGLLGRNTDDVLVPYLQVLLSHVGNPECGSFAKVACLVEAELRTAVLFNDALAIGKHGIEIVVNRGSTAGPLQMALVVAAPFIAAYRRCPPAYTLMSEVEKMQSGWADASTASACEALMNSLQATKLALTIFANPELSSLLRRCPQTSSALAELPSLRDEKWWRDTLDSFDEALSDTRALLADFPTPPQLGRRSVHFEAFVRRGVASVPPAHELINRLREASDDDTAALDVELSALLNAKAAAQTAIEVFNQGVRNAVQSFYDGNPFAKVVRDYGIAQSLNAAHECDVIKGSTANVSGRLFEESLFATELPTIIDQILAPDCAAVTDFNLPQAVEWCSWCLVGRHEGAAVPTFAVSQHEDGALPVYSLLNNVGVMEKVAVRPPAASPDHGKEAAAAVEGYKWSTSGELDAVLTDERTGDVLFLFELKVNMADLGKAHKQREKLFSLIDSAWNVKGSHANPNATVNEPLRAQPTPEVQLWFSDNDHRSLDVMRKHFTDGSRASRWVYTTSVPVTKEGKGNVRGLASASAGRHLLESTLAQLIGQTVQFRYGYFVEKNLCQTRALTPTERRNRVLRVTQSSGPKESLYATLFLHSLCCRSAERDWVPFNMPFVTTDDKGHEETVSSSDVVRLLRYMAQGNEGHDNTSTRIAFAFPLYESPSYNLNVARGLLTAFRSRYVKCTQRAISAYETVRELIANRTLRCLLLLTREEA